MSSSCSSSSNLEETSRKSLNSDTQYPHKQPNSDTEYFEFFESLFNTDLAAVDQQELKAICLVIEAPPETVKPKFKEDPRLFSLFHCIISRADITFQELFLAYSSPHSAFFTSLIPVLLWVFVSQKSKRFVEPFLVQYFEQTRAKCSEFCAEILNGLEIPRLVHKPVSNEEKNFIVLCYLVNFLQNFSQVCEQSISTFLSFCKNLVNGVENPDPNIDLILSSASKLPQTLQFSLTPYTITVLLLIASRITSQKKAKKKALLCLLSYCQKELHPQGILLAKYLLDV